ncbi:MAG: beta-galactosidase [Kiritimatiellae bacterium]|nr:beta-galactosidase [Kiritimatiellia bacterium]
MHEINRTFLRLGATACAAALSLSGLATGAGHPFGLDDNHPYGVFGDAYVTPHVKWAKPLSGGKIKALVLAPQWSQRETVELSQRLDLDVTPWMSSGFRHVAVPGGWYMLPTPTALIDDLLRRYAAARFDVIVVGKLDWAMLPAKQRFDLMRQVADGAGLVYVCPPATNAELNLVYSRKAAPEGAAFIAGGIPFAALPQLKHLAPDRIVRAGYFGKGRVVALDYGQDVPLEKNPGGNPRVAAAYPALTPQWDNPEPGRIDEDERSRGFIPPDACPEAEFVPYEYYQSLVARAVVWASGRLGEPRIVDVALPGTVADPSASHAARVTAAAVPTGAMLKAAVRSRHEYERVCDLLPQSVAATNTITLPALSAGDYFLDVWLATADGAVLDWSSRAFAVTADIAVDDLVLGGTNYNRGATVTGGATLSRALAPGETVIASLGDNHGRVIGEQPLVARGNACSFAFDLVRPLTTLHHVRVRVLRDGREVCSRRLTFPVRAKLKGFDDFHEIVWSSADNQFLTHQMLRKLAQDDQADAIYTGWRGATHARNIALANLDMVPYTASFGHFGGKTVPVAPRGAWGLQNLMSGCMSHPETAKYLDEFFSLQGSIFGPYGPLSWSHGDECYYANHPDTCWSDTCLAAFREFLKGRHTGLDALNADWKTTYRSWDEVMPLTFEEAVATGRYAPWIEHRLAQQLVWARHYAYTSKALSAHDPRAHVGFDGNNGFNLPNGGINWWVLKDHVGELHGYIRNSEEMEIFRSFAGPGHLSGMWYGTYGPTWQIGPATVEYNHFFPWYSLFHGLNSTWFYAMGAPGTESGYAPDLSNLPFMQASRDALRDIRGGIGKLLLSAARQADGIAIHYSEGSRLAEALIGGKTTAQLEGGISLAGARPTLDEWSARMADINKALEHAGLQYRYLAYEEVEADALVARGYKVFIMPQCRAVSDREAAAIRRFVQGGGLLIADDLPGILNGHGTRRATSVLADLFPSSGPGVVNAVGRGRTVLIGNALEGYGYAAFRNMKGWRQLAGRHRMLAELIAKEAGIVPRVTAAPRGQEELPPTETFRFVAGGAEYVGLLREYFMYDFKPYPVTVRLPRKAHVYDMRRGAYLGHTDRLETELGFEAHLYALLPRRIRTIRVEGPSAAKPGETSAFTFAVGTGIFRGSSAPRVYRVEVLDPAGRTLPWYAENVLAREGRGQYTINWALNERPGQYTVQVKDVASGVCESKSVVIGNR